MCIRDSTIPGHKPQGKYPSTVAFIVHVNSLPGVDETPGLPCGLLACFGMDGYSTLIWNRIVRLKYPLRWRWPNRSAPFPYDGKESAWPPPHHLTLPLTHHTLGP